MLVVSWGGGGGWAVCAGFGGYFSFDLAFVFVFVFISFSTINKVVAGESSHFF